MTETTFRPRVSFPLIERRIVLPDSPNDLTYVSYGAFFRDQGCELLSYHAPVPVMVEYHHQRPVFLQDRLYGKIKYGPSLWVCGNCHDAIHAWLYWLLDMRRQPPWIGRAAKAEAERTAEWYAAEVLAA